MALEGQGKPAEVDRVVQLRLAQPLVLLRADEDDERALPRGAGRDRRRRTQADRRAQRRRWLDLRVGRLGVGGREDLEARRPRDERGGVPAAAERDPVSGCRLLLDLLTVLRGTQDGAHAAVLPAGMRKIIGVMRRAPRVYRDRRRMLTQELRRLAFPFLQRRPRERERGLT